MQTNAIDRAASARGDTIGTVYSEKRSGKTLARRPSWTASAPTPARGWGTVYRIG